MRKIFSLVMAQIWIQDSLLKPIVLAQLPDENTPVCTGIKSCKQETWISWQY